MKNKLITFILIPLIIICLILGTVFLLNKNKNLSNNDIKINSNFEAILKNQNFDIITSNISKKDDKYLIEIILKSKNKNDIDITSNLIFLGDNNYLIYESEIVNGNNLEKNKIKLEYSIPKEVIEDHSSYNCYIVITSITENINKVIKTTTD